MPCEMNSEHNSYCEECNTCYVCLGESQPAKFKVSHDILERLKEHVEFHESIDTHKTDAAFLRIVAAEVEKLLKENKKLLFMIDNGLGYEDLQQDSMQSHIN